MSMKITKAKLLELIMEEVESSLTELNPFKTLADQTPEDLADDEDEDSGALRGDDVLAVKGPRVRDIPEPDSWPVAPGQEAIMQAFNDLWDAEYMAKLKKKLSPQDYKEVEADFQRKMMAQARKIASAQAKAGTVAMAEPPKKKKRFGFFENAEGRSNAELLKLLRTMLQTARQPYTDEQKLLSLGADLQAMLDQLGPSDQWAKEQGFDQPTYSEEMERYIREELEAYLNEKKTKVSKPGQKRVSDKIGAMTDAGECDDNPKQCQAIAYSYEERGKLPKKEGKRDTK